VTGGVFLGDRDAIRDLLAEAGGAFVRVAMRPGEPQGRGRRVGCPS